MLFIIKDLLNLSMASLGPTGPVLNVATAAFSAEYGSLALVPIMNMPVEFSKDFLSIRECINVKQRVYAILIYLLA